MTSIELDHPDIFPNIDAVADAFHKFIERVVPGGLVVGCGDQPQVERELTRITGRNSARYGFGEANDWRASDLVVNSTGATISE